jgi:hypothetical protein
VGERSAIQSEVARTRSAVCVRASSAHTAERATHSARERVRIRPVHGDAARKHRRHARVRQLGARADEEVKLTRMPLEHLVPPVPAPSRRFAPRRQVAPQYARLCARAQTAVPILGARQHG